MKKSMAMSLVWSMLMIATPSADVLERQEDCEGYPFCPPSLVGAERDQCLADVSDSMESCLADPRIQHTQRADGVWQIVGIDPGAEDTSPTALVVFAHGWRQTIEESWCHHMVRVLTDHPEVVVAATNYRDNCGYPALKGAEDLIDLTRGVLAEHSSISNVYLLGASMGGTVSGTAIAEAVDENGEGLIDYWIDVEGITMILETWAAARAARPVVAEGMEWDAAYPDQDPARCCTPLDDPAAFARRSPVLRAGEMAAGGLRGASVVHGMNDGSVPYDQAREMAAVLAAAGVPTRVLTVLRAAEKWDNPDDETRATGYATEPIEDATADESGAKRIEDPVRLAGHGWEKLADHPVMRAAFEELDRLLEGTIGAAPASPIGIEEIVVDESLDGVSSPN